MPGALGNPSGSIGHGKAPAALKGRVAGFSMKNI